MSIDEVLKLLTSLGISPLEILTIIALVVVYRKNEDLWNEVMKLRDTLDECVGKLPHLPNRR